MAEPFPGINLCGTEGSMWIPISLQLQDHQAEGDSIETYGG